MTLYDNPFKVVGLALLIVLPFWCLVSYWFF